MVSSLVSDNSRRPDWAPLLGFLGEEAAGAFMFMGCTQAGETKLWLYKHIETRRYLHLSGDGTAYLYRDESYVEVTAQAATDHVYSLNH